MQNSKHNKDDEQYVRESVSNGGVTECGGQPHIDMGHGGPDRRHGMGHQVEGVGDLEIKSSL